MTFTSPPSWLDRYALHGEDKDALRRLFPESARASLVLPAGSRMEGAGEWVIVYAPERDLEPAAFAAELSAARTLVEAWTAAEPDRA